MLARIRRAGRLKRRQSCVSAARPSVGLITRYTHLESQGPRETRADPQGPRGILLMRFSLIRWRKLVGNGTLAASQVRDCHMNKFF